MNKQKYQSGFAHNLIIIIAIVVVIIGSLGYVFWKNFMQPKSTADNTSITSPDGTIVTAKLDADGKAITITTAPDGTATTTKSDGTVVVEKVNPNGTVVVTETKPGGTTPTTTVRPVVTAPGVPSMTQNGVGASPIAAGYSFAISGAGAEGYEVFKSTNSGEYAFYNRMAASPAGSSVTIDVMVYRGETSSYKARAYKKDGEAYVYSDFSSPQTKTLSALGIPTISIGGVGADENSYGFLFIMSTSDEAHGYQLFRSTSGANGEYTLLEQINNTNEFSVTIPADQTYYYKAKAFVTDGQTTIYSDFSAVKASRN